MIILEEAGKSKTITVATNTAGRGTDIKLDKTSLQSGGLHVLITFFSNSFRVEEQARGRAGRQGEPGSSEVIFLLPSSLINRLFSKQLLEVLLLQRENEARSTKEYHIYIAKLDRYRFKLIQEFFYNFDLFYKSKKENVEILLRAWLHKSFYSKQPIDLSHLSLKESFIAKEAAHLLNEGTEEKWRIFLDTIYDRIKDLIIESWSRCFNQKVDMILNCSELNQMCMDEKNIDQTSSSLSQDAIEKINQVYNELLQKIQNLFKQKNFWNTYMSTNGINKYLKTIIFGNSPYNF